MRKASRQSNGTSDVTGMGQVHWDSHFRDSKGRIVPPADVYEAPIADTHCHLDMLPEPGLALARAAFHGIRFLVDVVDPTEQPGYSYDGISGWLTEAAGLLGQWAAADSGPSATPANLPDYRLIIGCHPHNAAKYDQAVAATLISYLDDPRTAAIGEIGLDYHYDASPRDVQRQVFADQLKLAGQYGLPVSLHLRDAYDDGLAILDQQGWLEAGVLLHCYTLGPSQLEPFLEHGAYVAFGGTLTFKNADDLREAARQAPLQRVMTETDAPFMAPVPLRGTPSGPEHTLFTAARLAEVRGLTSPAEAKALLGQIYDNALAFFCRG